MQYGATYVSTLSFFRSRRVRVTYRRAKRRYTNEIPGTCAAATTAGALLQTTDARGAGHAYGAEEDNHQRERYQTWIRWSMGVHSEIFPRSPSHLSGNGRKARRGAISSAWRMVYARVCCLGLVYFWALFCCVPPFFGGSAYCRKRRKRLDPLGCNSFYSRGIDSMRCGIYPLGGLR